MELTDENYYQTRMLSVSTVRQFAQNPQRALANFKGEQPWFSDNKALPLGTALHDMLEQAMKYVKNKNNLEHAFSKDKSNWQLDLLKTAEIEAQKSVLDEMYSLDNYAIIRTKKGALIADAKQIPELFSIIWNSDDIKLAALKAMVSITEKEKRYAIAVEQPFVGLYVEGNNSIKYKGKPDLFVVDHKHKEIDAYDYKTSKTFSPSGYEWGTNIYGKRSYMPVEWEVEKLFPWQAGVYRELLRQNGYVDYQINYKYLVVTKEKTPRFNVFKISDASMDEGFEQFSEYLVRAYKYIKGDLKAPLTQDGSSFANKLSQKAPLEFTSEPYIADDL